MQCHRMKDFSLESLDKTRILPVPCRTVACESSRRLIVYTKPDCPLCDGLKDKVSGLISRSQFMPNILTEYGLEIRDVSKEEEWSNAYAGEVPVLAVEVDGVLTTLPRPPPRITAERLQQHIEKSLGGIGEILSQE